MVSVHVCAAARTASIASAATMLMSMAIGLWLGNCGARKRREGLEGIDMGKKNEQKAHRCARTVCLGQGARQQGGSKGKQLLGRPSQEVINKGLHAHTKVFLALTPSPTPK